MKKIKVILFSFCCDFAVPPLPLLIKIVDHFTFASLSGIIKFLDSSLEI